MSNLTIPAAKWLVELFEMEYCAECGGDQVDHTAVPFMDNWFARCDHPIPDAMRDDEIEQCLAHRMWRKRRGLPLIAE